MTESIFSTLNNIVNEVSYTSDVLRIIAKDSAGLKTADRAALVRGAEELEMAYGHVSSLANQIDEARRQLNAAQTHIAELSRKEPAVFMMRLGPTIIPASMVRFGS